MWKTLFLTLLFSGQVAADIYKCKSPNGQVTVLDHPCPVTSRTEVKRQDEFVTQDQQRQAASNAESMRQSAAELKRNNCLDSAQMAQSKTMRDKMTANCLGRTYVDDDSPPTDLGTRVKNCNAWGCYDTSGNYTPRN